MIRTLLCTMACVICSSLCLSQISPGQTSDFQSGTEGWKHNISNAFEPEQIMSGGPLGAADAFLRTTNSGTSGAGSRHAVINTNTNWIGDYSGAGIVALTFDVQNSGSGDLHLRLAFRSASNPNDWAASANALVIPSGQSWTFVSLSTVIDDLIMTQGNGTVAGVMSDVSQVRIVSNDGSNIAVDPLHKGQLTVLVSDYDNITAVDALSNLEFQKQNDFRISPNPAREKLNLILTSANDVKLEVFDVLGKRIYRGQLSQLRSSIDVSNWKSGIYLVKVSNDSGSQTKRFVKQ